MKMWPSGRYSDSTCKTKKTTPGYGKVGLISVPIGLCMLDSSTTWKRYTCVNDTAVGHKIYNNSACTSQYLKETKAVDDAFVTVCTAEKGNAGTYLLSNGKCGVLMDCSVNATTYSAATPSGARWYNKYYDCKVKVAAASTNTTKNGSKKASADATAVSATAGLVISALALCV